MREIKFRAWDESNKVIHNDFQFIKSGDSGNDWIIFKSDKQESFDRWVNNPYFSQQMKIMQYTGAKDKTGNYIYENDIIECEYYDGLPTTKNQPLIWRGLVKYGENHTHYYVSRIGNISGTYSVGFGGSAVKRWEVIGNIYENPELLK